MFACIYVPNASADAARAVLECAARFSPRVENSGDGAVVFDVDGLERLFGGYSEIAEKIQEQTRACRIEAHIAIASNAGAAMCAARGFRGITVIPRGAEAARLASLPVGALAAPPEIVETLDRWGVRTLGAFAKLPAAEISTRLGPEGVQLHKLARGENARPIVRYAETLRFVETMDLDYEITTIEPLTFILTRMLDQICARLRSRNLATQEVRLTVGAVYDRARFLDCDIVRGHRPRLQYTLNIPVPVRNSRLLTKLLILDLEAHPPGAAIQRIELEAFPAKPRAMQSGLFTPLAPEAEKLEVTLARLNAVVGEGNVGSPEVLDEHRPDAFRIRKFQTAAAGGVPPTLSTANRLIFRRFRPPLEATVQLRSEHPSWIAFHGVHGRIDAAAGPWRTSGDWWRPTMWDREEWDIEAAGALYRIYYDVHLDRWYAEGVYD